MLTLSILPSLRLAFALLLPALAFLCPCEAAKAQTNASVSFVSNYLFRGMSLSEGNPVVQANLEYDGADGWYAGLFASPISIEHNAATAQLLGYGGYSQRLWDGWSWDAGATSSRYVRDAESNYTEIFAGLAAEHLSGRVSWSADYLGLDARTLYAELNANYPLFAPLERMHLLAHLGYLHVPSPPYSPIASRYDSRLGLGTTVGNWDVQLAWVAVVRNQAASYYGRDFNAHAGVASVSYSF